MPNVALEYHSAIVALEKMGFTKVPAGRWHKRIVELRNAPIKVRIILESFDYRIQVGAVDDEKWYGIDFVAEFLAPQKFRESPDSQIALVENSLPAMREFFSSDNSAVLRTKLERYCEEKSAGLLQQLQAEAIGERPPGE